MIEQEELAEVCEANGIEIGGLVAGEHKGEKVKRIDVFQLAKVEGLAFTKHFRYLVELCVLQQRSVADLNGIGHCVLLERLWVTECSLDSTRGLENCTNLQELYLDGNRIVDIESLNGLYNLKKLWLNSNLIRKLNNLDGMSNLHSLWLASNRIERIGKSLDSLVGLRELNLARNRITSFKEILNLTRLPELRTVCFRDPHFGTNPVCSLCNYRIFVLHHLSQIEILDTLTISEESRQIADATYMKKRMYYNMRVKTLKRSTANVIRKAWEIRQAATTRCNSHLNVLLKEKKAIDKVLEEHHWYGPRENENPERIARFRENKVRMENAIDTESAKIRRFYDTFEHFKQKVWEISEELIEDLLRELETGGNIRLVEGKPQDPWVSSCAELLQSRFDERKFELHGIYGIKVNRVLRIHNRMLRAKFEKGMERAQKFSKALRRHQERINQGNSPARRSDMATDLIEDHRNSQLCEPSTQEKPNSAERKRLLEYLFYAQPIQEEIAAVIQKGFGKAYEYERGLQLWNCLVPKPLLSKDDFIGIDVPKNWKGKAQKMIVAKVYLGNHDETERAKAITKPYFEPNQIECRTELKLRHLCSEEYESTWCDDSEDEDEHGRIVWKTRDDRKRTRRIEDDEKTKQRAETIRKHKARNGFSPSLFWGFHSAFQNLETNLGDSSQKKWTFFDETLVLPEYLVEFEYLGYAENKREKSNTPVSQGLISKQEAADAGPLLIPLMEYIETMEVSQDHELDSKTEETKREPSSRFAQITVDTLKHSARGADPSALLYLNLHGNRIEKIENLEACVNLQVLVLSFNGLTRISGLSKLIKLQRLELGFNLIKTIEGLETLSELQVLELNNNLIYRLEDLLYLKTHNHDLTDLDLRNNAICEIKHYKSTVLSKLCTLQVLDGISITERDRDDAKQSQVSIDSTLIRECGRGEYFRANQKCELDNQNEIWYQRIEQLDLNRKRIRRIENLDKLSNLRRVTLADNEISRIEGLANLVLLEELCLEDNRILKLEGLDTLHFLQKLDIGNNKLMKLENLDSLVNLTQLSVEDNEIQHLEGLEKLANLMELYIGNNRIKDQKQVQNIKGLTKLIILDLLGNPLCTEDSYRLYTIYYLRRLKVLDGKGVDASEQELARETYSGKLNLEFLQEKIGHKYYEHIRELDLRSCRIQDVEPGTLCGDRFTNLREINLSRNNLSNLNGLSSLSTLQVLRANHNKIEHLRTPETSENIGLKGMPNLEVLQLGFNKICDTSSLCLHHVPKLKVLFLQGNEIENLSGLESCTELRELVLDRNKIRTLENIHESISSLTSLRALRMEENGIRVLGRMDALTKLHSLYLGFNRISDTGELEKLSSIPFLLELSLSNNPVARKQTYRPSLLRSMPSLKFLDGKEITQEERERVDLLFAPDANTAKSYISSGENDGSSKEKVQLKMRSIGFDNVVQLGVYGFHTGSNNQQHEQQGKNQGQKSYASVSSPGSSNFSKQVLPNVIQFHNNTNKQGNKGRTRSTIPSLRSTYSPR